MQLESNDTLFAKAVRENWTSEMDWLWLASKVERDDQLIICLRHALKLNPDNENTRQQLSLIDKKSSDGTDKKSRVLRNIVNSTKQLLF